MARSLGQQPYRDPYVFPEHSGVIKMEFSQSLKVYEISLYAFLSIRLKSVAPLAGLDLGLQ